MPACLRMAGGTPSSRQAANRRAESVAGRLRAMTEAISDQTSFTKLQSEIFQQSHRVSDRWKATDQILEALPAFFAFELVDRHRPDRNLF